MGKLMRQTTGNDLSIRYYLIHLFFLLMMFSMAGSVDAAIYSCHDGNGNVYLTDSPGSEGQKVNAPYELLLPDIDSHGGGKGKKDIGASSILTSLFSIAQQKQLPSALLMAVIKVESNFNPKAVSPMGAKGLMQLMPGVCEDYGVTDPFDIVQNISAGAGYLREMIDRFNNLEKALAAYNAGPGAVEKYGGVPPFDETKDYLKRIYNYLKQYYGSN